MKFYWRVRIYRPNDDYWTCQIMTEPKLEHIDIIQAFYTNMTGCRMLLEGMSSTPQNLPNILEAFTGLYKGRID